MKVPFSWLTEYCDPGLGADQVAELLSLRAVEVERVTRVGVDSGDGFVIGRVISAERHPNADRLSVCEVEDGEGVRTIVCGAPNVAAGQTVAVALPGARLADGTKLKRAKLRGIESNGMILSEAELQLSDEHDGILVLDASAGEPGAPLAAAVPIADAVLELDLNPNRVDCMGVYGVARELHALTGAPLAEPPWATDQPAAADTSPVDELASVAVEVAAGSGEALGLCPRFTARALLGIELAPSPPWLKARLVAAGQRPISNAVDITNYVMLMLAQPLHAFDLDRVPGGEIIVRTAHEGESMTTLDDVERRLDPHTVVVCDRERATGIAGIMGGQVSEISSVTANVLLEAATWNGVNILRTSGVLGLRSEASARFEKQLHPELAMRAQRVASRLFAELCGARLAPGTIDVAAEMPPPHVISLHGSRLDALLGVHVERAEASDHLSRLGFGVEDAAQADLIATVPVDRHFDVTREVDLIEEVGRLHGFDRLPRTLPESAGRAGGLSRGQAIRRRGEDRLRDLGFDEIVAWHLVDPGLANRLRLPQGDPRRDAVATENPISEDLARMRTTLLGGLLDAARHNLARGAERIALFESGRAYLAEPPPTGGGPAAGRFAGAIAAPVREPHRLAALVAGQLVPVSWLGSAEPGDGAGFYALKGVLELLATAVGAEISFAAAAEPFLHPGRSASIELGGAAAGWLGELHPLVARDWDLRGGAGFELDLAALIAAASVGEESYEDLTTHPSVLQDLAVTIDDEVAAERVRDAVREGGGALLERAEIFDLYRGEQLREGSKSLALRLEFRAPDRTLTDAEVGALRERIKEALAALGGSLRE